MDQEGRIATRYKCDKRAIAEYGGDKYPCMIRDLSSTGAAIESVPHRLEERLPKGHHLRLVTKA